MSPSSPLRSLPGGGPGDVLHCLARHFGIGAGRGRIGRLVARHRSPDSLLCLVEVGREIGIEAKGYRGGLEDLEGASLPALVHLQEPETGRAVLSVLLERREDSFLLEDLESGRPVPVERSRFEEAWTGVLVLVSPKSGVKRRSALGRLYGKLKEAIGGGASDPAAGRAATVAAVAGVPGLGLLAALRASSWFEAACAAGIVVALAAGAFASYELVLAGRRVRGLPAKPGLASSLCGRGTLADCQAVLGSRYARIGGTDLASIGLAFFSGGLLLSASGILLGRAGGDLFAWLAASSLAALPVPVALAAVQVWPLRRFCPLCMLCHVSVLCGALCGLPFLSEAAARPGTLSARFAPFALLHAVSIAVALGILVPAIERRLEASSLGEKLRVVFSTPLGFVAELAARKPEPHVPAEGAARIGEDGARFRVDAFVHPTCVHCRAVVDRLATLGERRKGVVRIVFHVPPRDPANPADRELARALAGAGMTLSGRQALELLRRVESEPSVYLELAREGAQRVLERLLPNERVPEEAMARARETVEAASTVLDRLGSAMPAVLFEGRFWDGTVEQLEELLARETEILEDRLARPSTTPPSFPVRSR